ncbi:hypothetical protein D9M71_340660 [compost metagenome]
MPVGRAQVDAGVGALRLAVQAGEGPAQRDEAAEQVRAVQPGEQEEERVGRVAAYTVAPGGELLPDQQLADQEGDGEGRADEHAEQRRAVVVAPGGVARPLQAGAGDHQQGGVQPQPAGAGQGRQRIGQRLPVAQLRAGDEGDQEQKEQRADHRQQHPQAYLGGAPPVQCGRFAPAARVVAVQVLEQGVVHGLSPVAAAPLRCFIRSSSSRETVCGT